MEQRETDTLLLLTLRGLKFATDHPYAATGIFGAAVGSALTYKVMTFMNNQSVSDILTPKVYKIDLPTADLRRLLNDPTAEVRWDLPESSVIISSEEVDFSRALPVIDGEGEDIE